MPHGVRLLPPFALRPQALHDLFALDFPGFHGKISIRQVILEQAGNLVLAGPERLRVPLPRGGPGVFMDFRTNFWEDSA